MKEKLMRAVKLTGPKKLEVVETNAPAPDGKNVIIKVTACGICGSDLHYWELGVDMNGLPGLIMGHEFSGTVVEPGSRNDLSYGDRVTALPVDPCGQCYNCCNGISNICLNGMKRPAPGNNAPGAYAEFISVRPDMVRRLPNSVTDMEGALVEPAAVALHAVKKAGVQPGDRVLITGGGPIGVLCSAWASLSGASYVALTEIDPFRIGFAPKTGFVNDVFDAADRGLKKSLKKASMGGFDIAIETSGSDAGINTGVSALKPQGRTVLAGINFSSQSVNTLAFTVKELTMHSVFSYLLSEFDVALDFISKEKLSVKSLATHTIHFEDVQDAFEKLTSSRMDAIKVIIQP